MKPTIRTFLIALAISFTIAGAADVLILLIASVIDGAPPYVEVPGRSTEIGAGPILFFVFVGSLGGGIVAAVLRRWRWGLRVFVAAGVLVTLVSLVAVGSATTPTGVVALALMHVVTGGTIVAVNVILHRHSLGAAHTATLGQR